MTVIQQQNDLVRTRQFAETILTELRDGSVLFAQNFRYWLTNPMEFSTAIIGEFRTIPTNTLQKYVDNVIIRLGECKDKNGPHLEEVVFRT